MRIHWLRLVCTILGLVLPGFPLGAERCTEIYLFVPYYGYGSRASSTAEVFVQSGVSQEFELRGMLLHGDWGAFKDCGQSIAIKVRWLRAPGSSRTQKRVWDSRVLRVDIAQAQRVYVDLGKEWGQLPEQKGKQAISEIDANNSPRTIAGWDFDRDRYDLLCRDCDVRPPEASRLRP